MKMEVFYHGARIVLGVVFIYASIHKIASPEAFAVAVYNYRILPDVLINITALILPWLELVTGMLLLFGAWMPGASVIVTGLLSCFTCALVFNMARGLDIACGCFSTGSGESQMTLLSVLRDSSLLALAVFLLYRVFAGKERR